MLRTLIVAFILLASPVTVAAVGYGYMQIFTNFGLAAFMVACAAFLTCLLGFASLSDKD